MSLEYAILGFLQHKPISGYDMKKMFDSSIKHFWSADQSQIYRTLNKLTNEGLIEMEVVLQEGKPNSKIYNITNKGRSEFINWLSTPMSMPEPRIPWLIQVFFSAKLPDGDIINIFNHTANQIRNRIIEYEKINKIEFEKGTEGFAERDLFFIGLTYDYGLMLHNSVLSWIEKVIKQIQER